MKHKFTIIVLLLAFLFTHNISQALAPEVQLQDQPIKAIVTHFAKENDTDERVLLAMMQCESSGNQSAIGDGGRARGIYQYHKATWERISKAYGEELDINSSYDQAKLTAWAVANGYGNEWTSHVSIKKGGTYSFYSKLMKQHYTVKCSV